MAFNASEFRARLQGHGQRPNMYEVKITFPDVTNDVEREFTFMCRASSSPGFFLGRVDAPYFGRRVSFAGDRVYEDWNVRVIDDEDHVVRNAFESWSNRMSMIDHDTNKVENFEGRVVYADAEITMMSKDGTPNKTYYLKNAWPLQVSPVELAWDANDQIVEFDVSFAYDYFITDRIEGLDSQQ